MSDFIYGFLEKIGYHHPLHPVLVHMPIGLVVAAFLLSCAALLMRRSSLATSAYHDLVAAFVFFFPSAFMGIVDWQRYYHGAWLPPIRMKLLLAPVLLLLLSAGVFMGYRQGAQAKGLLFIYLLSLLTVSTMGYFGGQLTFGGRSPAASVEFAAGQKLYEANCSACHAHGGNVLAPNLPLRSAPQLRERNEFIGFLRHPQLAGGGKGIMPAYSRDELSDQDAAQLYAYIQRYVARSEPHGQ
ncbi:MAG: DUF2231 domain-containing protein [Gammaproteobacteria bacterium]